MSLDTQIACVKREIALREVVFPKRVAIGKMKADKAQAEISAMREVLETLLILAKLDACGIDCGNRDGSTSIVATLL